MAIRTWEVIKAEIDAANPTPALVWYIHLDNPGHAHDDQSAARAEADLDGRHFVFEAHLLRPGPSLGWHGLLVTDEFEMRMPTGNGVWSTWAEAKPQIAAVWEAEYEKVRTRMAAETLASEQLEDDGIVASPARSRDASLSGLTGNGVTFTLVPGTYAYSSPILDRQTVLTAVTSHPAASVAFTYFSGRPVISNAKQLLFNVRAGANLVMIAVTAEDGRTQSMYTFAITRT